jgi:hypothetical protein
LQVLPAGESVIISMKNACLEELLETRICWSVLCVLVVTIKIFCHKIGLNVQLWEVAPILKCFIPKLSENAFY